MDQKRGEKNRPFPTDEEIEQEMVEQIGAFCVDVVDRESEQLALDLSIINAAIVSRELDKEASVSWVKAILTDNREVEKFIAEVAETNCFYHNRDKVERLVDALTLGMKNGLFSSEDSLENAFTAIDVELTQNLAALTTRRSR